MSAKNPQKALVARLSSVYYAEPQSTNPFTTGVPTTLDSAVWTLVGNTKTAPVITQTIDNKTVQFADFDQWLVLSTRKESTLKFPVAQFDADTWKLILGTDPDVHGSYVVGTDEMAVKDVYVEYRWGNKVWGFYFPGAVITAQGDLTPTADDAASIELTFTSQPSTVLNGGHLQVMDGAEGA